MAPRGTPLVAAAALALMLAAAVLPGCAAIQASGRRGGAGAATEFSAGGSQADVTASSKNPVRKIVQLLEGMAKKVESEGEKEEALYKKFSCYCRTGEADLQQSISGNDAKVPALQSDIESAESTVAKLKEDLKQHESDRDAASKAMQEATALRESEHVKFAKESAELKSYIDALAQAIPAVSAGMAGTKLLQTNRAAAVLRQAVASDTQLTEDDRASFVAFLAGGTGESSGYVPSSGEVLGILQTMKEDFTKDLSAVMATEEEAVKLYEDLMAAKRKEVNTLSKSIEKKVARVGDLQVQVVRMKQDLTQAEAILIQDQKFLKDLTQNCESKQAEWDERKKLRAQELVAIHETIKILNDDDALDLFKKALPSSSFLQLAADRERVQRRAIAALQARRGNGGSSTAAEPEMRFLELVLQGGKVDFSKVIKMVDDMIALLAQEQTDDDGKREYCRKQIDNVEDKANGLAHSIDDLDASVEDQAETIATLAEEIKTLQAGITELDRLVEDATIQRKSENAEFTELMSESSEAKKLLEYAKNRLHKFYNPTMYTEPPKDEATEGGAEPAAPESAASALVQQRTLGRRHRGGGREAPGPVPETWGAYAKKGEETTSVISMLDSLIRDLTMEMTMAEKDEEHAQKAYEGLMRDSAGKRAKSVKAINIKVSAKADSELIKSAQEADKKNLADKLQATKMYEQQLHSECDWLVQNYELRKTARAEEVDNLKTAKAVLKGADFSLSQAARRPLLSRPPSSESPARA